MIVTIGARDLQITHSGDSRYWKFSPHPDADRHSEVAELIKVSWLDIVAKTHTQDLQPETNYGAYLVFKLDNAKSLESVRGNVRFANNEDSTAAEKRASLLHLQKNVGNRSLAPKETGRLPRARKDGWLEIELGNIYVDSENDGEVQARLFDVVNKDWKNGLVVAAVEFRPKTFPYVN